ADHFGGFRALVYLLDQPIALGIPCARSVVGEATFRARPMAHGGNGRLADRTLSDLFGRSPLCCWMVCRARVLPDLLDARARHPAFRNGFALSATRPFRSGAKSRARSAADDNGCVVGLDRARDESATCEHRYERRRSYTLDEPPEARSRRSEGLARADSQLGLSCPRSHRQHPGDGEARWTQ